MKEFFVAFFLIFALLAVIFGVWSYTDAQTYTVYQTWPDRRIVRVLDPYGKEVKMESLDGLTYDVIWVSPDCK